MEGTAKQKRQQWLRKKTQKEQLHFSIKTQKKEFQRKMRNGKVKDVVNGSAYKKLPNRNAKWLYCD